MVPAQNIWDLVVGESFHANDKILYMIHDSPSGLSKAKFQLLFHL